MTELITLRDKVLLFAEDDAIIRTKTLDVLTILFKKIILACDGQEALEKYADEKPDIIFTDIYMPKMNGIELIKNIRKENAHIPIIVFSSYSDQKTLLEVVNLDIDGYILKPSNLQNILETFTKCAKKISHLQPQSLQISRDVVYYAYANEILNKGQASVLSVKESSFLNLLISKYPATLTKEEAHDKVWQNQDVTQSAIKNIVSRLRSKIGDSSIVSVPGIGWRIVFEKE